jgi:D-alanyl-D-alanine carboxypeptidase (penicillin-binding protein 5/6)
MKDFLEFVKARPQLKIKIVLAFLFLSLLPGRNYYYSLDLNSHQPLVRSINQPLDSPSQYPVNFTGIPAPNLTARSAIVVDVDSKTILFNKNPDLKLLPASTTKIMTGLIVIENYDLDDIVTITSVSDTGQKMDLEIGERITVENLLYGLLVQSGNDAATALAQFHPDGQDAFIALMNQKLKDLNLHDTQFTNAAGLDAYGHYTTVHDLSLLAAVAMKNPQFKKIVSTQGITVSDVDQTIFHQLEAINELLGQIRGLAGIKTGWTELAGECLVTYIKRGDKQIITVVLGSQDRFGETQQLIDWAFTNHQWK